jgi:hypothetical protein
VKEGQRCLPFLGFERVDLHRRADLVEAVILREY